MSLSRYLTCPRTLVIAVLALLSVSHAGTAQDELHSFTKELPFKVYRTFSDSLTVKEIMQSPVLFKSIETFEGLTHPDETYWIQLDFKDELDTLLSQPQWYVNHTGYSYGKLYYERNGAINSKEFGFFDAPDERNSLLNITGIQFDPNTLIEGRYLYLEVRIVYYFLNPGNWSFDYSSAREHDKRVNYLDSSEVKEVIPRYLFSGICIIMFFFTLTFYIRSRRNEFLYYALYIVASFICLEQGSLDLKNILFQGSMFMNFWVFQISQVLINLFYLLFVIHYLNTRNVYPALHKSIRVMIVFLLGIIVLDTIFIFTKTFAWHIYATSAQRLVMTVWGLGAMVYLLLRRKEEISLFIVIGSFFYMAGALGWLFMGESIYMITGSAIEIFIFSLGLTYKIHKEFQDKIRFQKEAFANHNKALRAQMNPHFIFNSMASIQHLISSNNNKEALKYLSKFSSLMRGTLESSIETTTLDKEIELLRKYLELESLRFDDAFIYDIRVEEGMDPYGIEVPVFIIQPFVENAIMHGLLPKQEGSRELSISFTREGTELVCEIDDNGIGREAAALIHRATKNKSRGIEVTQKRLEQLNPSLEDNVTILDKKDSRGNSMGTTVRIRITTE